jgi:hypothetical protein
LTNFVRPEIRYTDERKTNTFASVIENQTIKHGQKGLPEQVGCNASWIRQAPVRMLIGTPGFCGFPLSMLACRDLTSGDNRCRQNTSQFVTSRPKIRRCYDLWY